MPNTLPENLNKIFAFHPTTKLVYFFGSRAEGKGGPLSDYDFAVYLDGRDQKEMFEVMFALQDQLGRRLKTNKIDVVILNLAEGIELKYNIIKQGRLIYEREPFKAIVEPRILTEYFDFKHTLRKYNLTNA